MKSYFAYCFRRLTQIAVAPFLLHWGHIPWVSDLASVITNASATQALFFLAIVFLIGSFFYKNVSFSVHRRRLFRYIGSYLNSTFFLAPFFSFFSAVKASFLVLKNFIKKLKF